MKNLSSFLLIAVLLTAFSYRSYSQDEKHDKGEAKGTKVAGGTLYGKEFTQGVKIIKIKEDIFDNPDSPGTLGNETYSLEGIVTDVCQSMGCWMMLSDPSDSNYQIRVQTLHKFFLPKDCTSSRAVVEGVFKVKKFSEEQARHLNDESKNSKIKSEDIIGPQTMPVIEATGIEILDKQ